jgi:hypothetical protein
MQRMVEGTMRNDRLACKREGAHIALKRVTTDIEELAVSAIQLLTEREGRQNEAHRDDGQLGQVSVRDNSIHNEGPIKGTLTEREAPTETKL